MGQEIIHAITQIEREKKIDRKKIHEAVEKAIKKAAERVFDGEDFGVALDPKSGDVEIWSQKEVVEEVDDPAREIALGEASLYYEGVEIGDRLQFSHETSKFGRIAAHTARQVIMQLVREAEKESTYQKFSAMIGDMVTGTVRRRDKRGVILELEDGTEAILRKEEQSPKDHYVPNSRFRVVILEVDPSHKASREPQVKVSRASGQLLSYLFRLEVPEIFDGTVILKNAAREAGERSKIAVYTNNPDVDPIGACVGISGHRVKAVIRELQGERLDIVKYSDDIATYTANALSPAKINRVIITDPFRKELEVIVDQDELSQAIGKRGQNARLASKLTGWGLKIKTEEQKRQEADAAIERLTEPLAGPDRIEGSAIAQELIDSPEELLVDAVSPEGVQEVEEGEYDVVPLSYLEGLQPEWLDILNDYDIEYIEDLLEVGRDVLSKIPELSGVYDQIMDMAEAYAAQFSAEEDENELTETDEEA
jgi:N utilization substance protein A